MKYKPNIVIMYEDNCFRMFAGKYCMKITSFFFFINKLNKNNDKIKLSNQSKILIFSEIFWQEDLVFAIFIKEYKVPV